MEKKSSNIILIITGAILFNLLFWEEKLAVNTLIFDIFILTAIFRIYPTSLKNNTVKLLLMGHLVCIAMIIFHNTLLSKIAFSITLLLLVGFSEYVHRSAWYAGGSVLLNFVLFIAGFFEELQKRKQVTNSRLRISRIMRFLFFPVLLCFIFFIVYSFANTVFADLISKATLSIREFFKHFFEVISIPRILFLLLGLYITGSLLLKSKFDYFSQRDKQHNDNLERKRLPRYIRINKPLYRFSMYMMGGFGKGILALKSENAIGIASMLLLNILLLLVNIIDIKYVWLNFQYSPDINVSNLVHEGTGLLIVSIIMAMLVVLFYFKGNLNFYQKNKWLKYGAYLWILQNAILVFSVFMRDYYYISQLGLAYKRIGVLFFLLMVLIGLITVAIKIYYKKTSYFLFRINAWAGLIILTLSTTVHWDEMMAKYNLAHQNSVTLDIPFLLSLSDKTLPMLHEEIEMFKQQEELQKKPQDENDMNCKTCYVEILSKRETEFFERENKYSWLSWNYADQSVSNYFSGKSGKATSLK